MSSTKSYLDSTFCRRPTRVKYQGKQLTLLRVWLIYQRNLATVAGRCAFLTAEGKGIVGFLVTMTSVRKSVVICVLFFTLYEFIQVKAYPCRSDSNCGNGQYCCKRPYPVDNVCRSNCIGESCILDSNCATGESCCGGPGKCNTSCVGKACSYDSDCATGETCCKGTNKCATSCVGASCSYDFDCATGETCCDGTDKCATSCIGASCSTDFDCATGECCDSDKKCKSGSCSLAGWIVAVIVISVLVAVVIPIGVVVFCCFCAAGAASSWRRPGHVILTQPATTGTTTVLATQQQQQLYPSGLPPYQPQGAVYPPEASSQSMAMLPQTGVKQ